jgi:hypothetical protein
MTNMKKRDVDADDAMLIAFAALAKAMDETGAVGRKAALLMRLASTMTDISAEQRARLAVLATLLEGTAGDGRRAA